VNTSEKELDEMKAALTHLNERAKISEQKVKIGFMICPW
jgi:hypothetical protein